MSLPKIDAVRLAHEHALSIVEKREKIEADLSCIRRLLVGRWVRRKGDPPGPSFQITTVFMTLSGKIDIRGRLRGKGAQKFVGLINDLELTS